MGKKASCLCSTLFWISVLFVTGYLFYCISILPMIINNHRLRYNQLNIFEIYKLNINDYFKFDISKKGINILTFKQQIDYHYKYLLATPTTITTSNYSDNNNTFIIDQLSWNQFNIFINDTDTIDTDKLCIIQYSESKCNINFEQCFNSEYNNEKFNQFMENENMLIYTEINNTYFINLNSELVSTILDDPRDGFMIMISIGFIIVIFGMLSLIQTKELRQSIYLLLLSILFIFFSYLLWLFILTIIPIFFSLTYNKYITNDYDYFSMISFSLVYTTNDYNIIYWVIGVIIHGIFAYVLTLSFPIISCLYGIILCFTCCNEQIAESISMYIVVPIIIILILSVCLMSISFLVLFVINIIDYTYIPFDVNNTYHIQILIGSALLMIILPILGCIMMIISKWIQNKYSNVVERSFNKLPMVKTMTEKHKQKFNDNNNYNRNNKNGYHDWNQYNQNDDGFVYENETKGMSFNDYNVVDNQIGDEYDDLDL